MNVDIINIDCKIIDNFFKLILYLNIPVARSEDILFASQKIGRCLMSIWS